MTVQHGFLASCKVPLHLLPTMRESLQNLMTLLILTALSTVHLIEEMPNPRRDAPWTMVLAVATGSVTYEYHPIIVAT